MIRRPRLHPLACALLLSLPLPAFAVDPVDNPPVDRGATAQDSQDRHGHETELKAVEIQGMVLPTTADEMTRPVEVLSLSLIHI